MRKSIIMALLLAALTLTGCVPEAQTTPTVAATSTSLARPAPTVVLSVPTQTNLLPDAGCTVISTKPTPGPTVESPFPPVSNTDWAKGPADARITIIEYSDFQ